MRALRSPAPSFYSYLIELLERTVAKKPKNKKDQDLEKKLIQRWVVMRRGLMIVGVACVVLAVLTTWQVIPSRGWMEGILGGLLFIGLIWVILFGKLFINKLLRR